MRRAAAQLMQGLLQTNRDRFAGLTRRLTGAMPPAKPAYYSPIMRRFAIPAVAVAVAAGLLALLAFGVAHQGTSSSIDA